MPQPVRSRLKLFQNWDHDVPLKFLWSIDFYPSDGETANMTVLGSNINYGVDIYEPNNWTVYDASVAAGIALLACTEQKPIKERNIDIKSFFVKFDNSGKSSRRYW